MNRIYALIAGLAILVCLATIPTLQSRVSVSEPLAVTDSDVQCGHWCVVRCSELLGVPVLVKDVVKFMPPSANGHSLHQLSQTFEKIGLQCTGRQQRFEVLQGKEGPWIVHLKDPDHFVVLISVEASEGRIHAFDPLGKRETIPIEQLRARWSGKLLEVRRPENRNPLPLYLSRSPQNPRIQFRKLFIDKGSVYANGQLATFEFEFENLGQKPLVIQGVRPSCACLNVDYTKVPIPANGTGIISVVVNPGNSGGAFLHSLDIETNDPVLTRLRLQASGYVSTDVEFNPPAIDLGSILPGATVQRQCFIQYHNNTTKLKLSNLSLSLPGADVDWIEHLNDAHAIKRLWPGAGSDVDLPDGVSVIQLTYTAPASASGKISAEVIASSNIPGFERIRIPVSGTALRPINFIPSILSFGEVDTESRNEATIRMSSPSGQSFQIVSVEFPGEAALDWKATQVNDRVQELVVGMSGSLAVMLSGKLLEVKVRLADAPDVLVCRCSVYATPKR